MIVPYSIVIPTKDRPKLLRRAVRSALDGLMGCAEILVVDDHSETPAEAVLLEFDDQRLRVVKLADGCTGVSAARNAGITAAEGDIIFFLDDDDEIRPDYCQHVLAAGVMGHDYGFSSYLETKDGTKSVTPARIRFLEGTIPDDASLGRRLCGFGMGFWIWRHVAHDIGPIDDTFSINEDTEYLCRLIHAGKMGWYSATPGVVLHTHAGPEGNLGHLTKRTLACERARCMRALCDLYPDMALYLGRGYIRHCLKTDAGDDAWHFAAVQRDWRVRSRLRMFAVVKMIAYRISGKVGSVDIMN